MAAIYEPVLSLADFERVLEDGDPYPYYAVLLYPPLNGLNAKLHKYVTNHWEYLNSLTGANCLLMTLNMRGTRRAKGFRPADVYAIARRLGASVNQVPCLVLIADPRTQTHTLVQPLKPLFLEVKDDFDDALTEFFQGVQAIIDRCAADSDNSDLDRITCLRDRINREFVLPARGRQGLAIVATLAGTVTQILQPISAIINALPH